MADPVKREKRRQWKQEWDREHPKRYGDIASKHDPLTYLVYSDLLGLFKIGITTRLGSRLAMLRNACPDAEVVKTWPYGRDLELWLHGYFREVRIPGCEWFKLENDLLTVSRVDTAVDEWVLRSDARDEAA